MAERDIRVKFSGDTKDLEKAAKDAEKSMAGSSEGMAGSMGSLAGKIAGASAAIGAAVAVAGAAWSVVQGAMEDEAAADALAQNLRTAAHATEPAIAAAENYISALSGTVALADDELRPALSRLATSTGDTAEAQDLLAVAADIAAGSGKDLGTVAEALAKGHEGQMKGLVGLGIETENAEGKQKSFAEVLEDAKSKFAGAGEAAANTTAGGMKKFGIGLDELKESIGAKFLPVLKAVFEFLNDKVLPALSTAFDAVSSGLSTAATFLGDVFATIGEKIAPVVDEVRGGITAFVNAFTEGSDEVTSSGFAGFLEGLGIVARNLFDDLTAGWAVVAQLWAEHSDQIMGVLATVAGFITGTLKGAFDALVAGVTAVAETVGGFWAEWGDEIIGVITTVAGAVVGFVTTIIEWGARIAELLTAFWAEWGDEIMTFVGAVIELVQALFDRIVAIAGPVLEVFVAVFKVAFAVIRTVVEVAFNVIITVLRTAFDVIRNIVDTGLTFIRFLWTIFGDSIMNIVGTVFGIIGSTIKFAFDAISNVVRLFTNILKGDWAEAWNNVVDTIRLAVFFVGNIMGTIAGTIGGALSGVADIILAPFRFAFNLIADIWNNTVGKLSFSFPDWIPGLGGRSIDVPDLPHFQGAAASIMLVMPPGTDGYDIARQVATFSRDVAPMSASVAVR